MSHREQVKTFMMELQDSICSALELADGGSQFQEDLWNRSEGGGGRTRVIDDGNVLEKGGVNFSAVEGPLPEKISTALSIDAKDFFATGVSIVLHPHNPKVPIIHMNVRYFETTDVNGKCVASWFGGGIDLTPHYVVDEDAKWFHEQLKAVCDQHDAEFYPKHKVWADEYFYIKHRKETRGVGGIFFDRLSALSDPDFEKGFDYVKSVGRAFAPIYVHFMNKNAQLPFNDDQKLWQKIRRGRYVEFNLVWDKGTKFGLDTDGRTESILMSLPKDASWFYDHQVKDGSDEAYTLSRLKKGIDWLD